MRPTVAILTACAAWALVGVPAAVAGPIVTGMGDEEPVDVITISYSTANPNVVINDGYGGPLEVTFDPAAGPIAKVFTVTSPKYHLLHIVETLRIVGRTVLDWHELLMVPDGEGGWMPSPNDDNLWWSCGYNSTPWPIVNPMPSLIEKLPPDDLLSIYWDPGLPDGTIVTIEKWFTVPTGMTTFAIFEYPTPEPAAMALVGLGLGWMTVSRRKRRKTGA